MCSILSAVGLSARIEVWLRGLWGYGLWENQRSALLISCCLCLHTSSNLHHNYHGSSLNIFPGFFGHNFICSGYYCCRFSSSGFMQCCCWLGISRSKEYALLNSIDLHLFQLVFVIFLRLSVLFDVAYLKLKTLVVVFDYNISIHVILASVFDWCLVRCFCQCLRISFTFLSKKNEKLKEFELVFLSSSIQVNPSTLRELLLNVWLLTQWAYLLLAGPRRFLYYNTLRLFSNEEVSVNFQLSG